ncbi:MAG: methyl-accepting chemotaxis protein [Deltaproteobacteria bacterium]|nr:methyl-accepting chemotaxis protein [Deltaproteobacteria bacterium]
MKIKHKFLIVFLVLMLLAVSATGYLSFKTTETAVVENALKAMENDLDTIQTKVSAFHEKAKSELAFALNYPVFKEYFSLKETKAGNRYNGKVIQFTPEQRRLKGKIDEWTHFVQSAFPIAETCVIDLTGQEHSRITYGQVAPDEDFSSDENTATFFEPTFKLKKGEVHVAYPYMSVDAKKWVFAYTSPIVLDDGAKPAFYHFEIPISYFQDIVSKHTAGRAFVLDPQGIIVADSKVSIDIAMKSQAKAGEHTMSGAGHKLKDYLPAVETISTEGGFLDIVREMKAGKSGTGVFSSGGQTFYVAYKPLSTFSWSVAEIKSYSELLEGGASLSKIKGTIAVSAALALIAAFVVVYVVSDRVTRPLLALTVTAGRVAGGELNVRFPEIDSKDEVASLQTAMKDMVGKLNEIVADVEMAADKVTGAGDEIQEHSEKMSGGIQAQANKAAQIATASEEMTRTIAEIARNTASISDTTVKAADTAEKGKKIVERSIQEVGDIADMVTGIARNIESLGERSKEIGNIVGVINDIADQTNLLALNAAIEAARAGEQGRGFAVVADEVRSLSERTAKATLQINEMIQAIQADVSFAVSSMKEGTTKVGQGVAFSSEAGRALGDIVESVKNLHTMIDQIVTAAHQLTSAAEQISSDIGEVAEVSKGASTGASDINNSAGALTKLSKTLQLALSRFKTD